MSVAINIIRKGPSSAELLKNSLAESKISLENHRKSAESVSISLDKGFRTSNDGNVSINETNSIYNEAVNNIDVIQKSSNQLNEFSNDMAQHNIKTRQMKTKLLNIVQQFTKDAAATGNNIVDLQSKIKSHVNDNTADILEMIQLDRENNFDSLASVKLRKGINGLSKKYNIPITRATASLSAMVFSYLGYKFGRMI